MSQEKFHELSLAIASGVAQEMAATGKNIVAGIIKGEAEGALPIGTIIEKCNTESEDSYPDGTRGIILASHRVGEGDEPEDFAYFCVFAVPSPAPTLIHGRRIRPLLLPE